MTPSFGIRGRIINDNKIFIASFKVALYLLMELSSKSTSLKKIPPIKVGLIGKKKLCSTNNMVVMDHREVFHLSKPQIPMIIP
jgi:hypothetical protein